MSSRERRSTADSQARARDRSLLEGLRRGEDEAFRALVDANTGPMLAVARRFLRNEDDARDAVQDAYLSAFRSIDRFEGDALLSMEASISLIGRMALSHAELDRRCGQPSRKCRTWT